MDEATKSLKERSDEELYSLVERDLSGPPYMVDRGISPDRPDDPDECAYVVVQVSVAAWDFPSDETFRG